MNTETKSAAEILARIQSEAQHAASAERLMQFVVEELGRIPHYNWVGFYMISASEREMLELGAFVGAATPHTRIPLNRGICGAAVTQKQTIVVDDVNSDARYLACSIETKSEIVVPIFVRGEVVGELDLDSHTPAAFTAQDRELLEQCAALVGQALEAKKTLTSSNGKSPGAKQVVAALILNAEGQLLICQRNRHQPLPLKWEFPGGKIEPGEQPEEALARELHEELGIEARIGKFMVALRHQYRNGNVVDLRFFLVREYGGELENRIFEEIRWADPATLASYDFLDADRELVRDLSAGKYL